MKSKEYSLDFQISVFLCQIVFLNTYQTWDSVENRIDHLDENNMVSSILDKTFNQKFDHRNFNFSSFKLAYKTRFIECTNFAISICVKFID